MKFTDVLRSILSSEKGSISSKRLCGLLGWFVCLGVLIYCTIFVIEAPSMVETVLITTASLLGIDSITNIWKSNNNKKEE
jgi:hypothetical protein